MFFSVIRGFVTPLLLRSDFVIENFVFKKVVWSQYVTLWFLKPPLLIDHYLISHTFALNNKTVTYSGEYQQGYQDFTFISRNISLSV